MKGLKRITLVILVLVGGVAFFGYWSINQFNQAFDNLSTVYLADAPPAYSYLKQKRELASTSPEFLGEMASSTDVGLASTSPKLSTASATSTDPKLSLNFPQKDTKVYIGCIYPITWQSATAITSFSAILVDAGTKETLGPNTSGLAKENSVMEKRQILDWKIGNVWPGAYYIKLSNINGGDSVSRSKSFIISKMPENLSTDEQSDICEESGGIF